MADTASSTAVDLNRFWTPPPATVESVASLRESLSELPHPPLQISRVAQLDAELLDTELEHLLVAPIRTTLATLPGPAKYEPELLAALRATVLWQSLWKNGATYGSTLQNLVYRNHGSGPSQPQGVNAISPRQKALALGLAVVPSYLRARLSPEISSWADEPMPRRWTSLLNITNLTKDTYSPARQRFLAFWRRVAWELVERGEKLVAVAGLVNFLIFLYNGRYRTLTERIAKMRLVYDKAQLAPNVSFEFLNRQLVWEAFTEFLLFLLPILPLARLRVLLARRLAASRAATSSLARLVPRPVLGLLGLAPPPPRSADAKPKQGPFHGLDKGLCAICMARDYPEDGASRPVAGEPRAQLAYRADCEEGCEYCYWCLGMELGKAEEVGESWECLRCCGEVRRMERVKGEVVVVTEEAGEVDSAAEEGEESEAEA